MKIIFYLLMAFSVSASAQSFLKQEIESNQVSDLTADEAWAMVNDWVKLHRLVPKVVESTSIEGSGLEAKWEILLTNGQIVKEKMVYFNPNDRVMSYTMTETPMPIKNYVATIKVEAYGVCKSLVSFYTSFEVEQENKDNIINTFTSFQETYLGNLKK